MPLISAAPLLKAAPNAPAAPVAIAKCASYDDDVTAKLATMFDQLGGLDRIVRGKTVTIKLNMTGSPGLRVQGQPPGVTHYMHPKLVGATAHLMGQAGAKRIRFVESAWATGGPLEDYLLDSGWNVRQLLAAAPGVEFENTNALGKGKKYARFKVPGGGYLFPGLRSEPRLRRDGRVRQHGQAEESRDLRRHALAEELLRHAAGVDLWRRRGRGRAERESHDRAAPRPCTRASGSLRNRRRRNSIRLPAASRAIACRTSWPTW